MKSEEEIKKKIEQLHIQIKELDVKIQAEYDKEKSESDYPDETIINLCNLNATWKSAEMFALQWVLGIQ